MKGGLVTLCVAVECNNCHVALFTPMQTLPCLNSTLKVSNANVCPTLAIVHNMIIYCHSTTVDLECVCLSSLLLKLKANLRLQPRNIRFTLAICIEWDEQVRPCNMFIVYKYHVYNTKFDSTLITNEAIWLVVPCTYIPEFGTTWCTQYYWTSFFMCI